MNKTLLILALIILKLVSTQAQNSFEIIVSTPVSEGITDFLEEETGSFLAVGYRGEDNPVDESMAGLIIRISVEGDTTIKIFSIADTGCFFSRIVRSYDNQYYIFGSTTGIFQEHNQNLMIIKMDTGLNILWRKVYDFGEQAHSLMQVLNDNQGGFHLISQISIDYKPYTLFCRIDKESDTIKSTIFNEFGPNSVRAAMYSLDSSQLYIFGTGFGSGAGSRVVFDTSYNYNYNTFLPGEPQPHMQAMRYSDTSILFVATYPNYDPGPQRNDIGIAISDTSFANEDVTIFGAVDTVDYTADVKTFDFRDNDSIYLLGTHNINFSFWPHEVSWISLRQLNGNLHMRSELFFGGDAYYRSITILATSDGGCLISAFRYDYQIQNEEDDIYILKLAQHDIITKVNKQEIIDLNSVFIYPNPVKNKLYFSTSEGSTIHKVSIYNQLGQRLLHEFTYSNNVNISEFKNGFYYIELSTKEKRIRQKFLINH